MIRIDRGEEPASLTRARDRQLTKAIAAFNDAGAPAQAIRELLSGYDPAKAQLFLAQHKKCAWCERRRDFSSSPVDHYRPKDGAWRHRRGEPRIVDPDCYWWLTWTWENLLFSCPRCNDQGHKANYFPLELGTARLPPPTPPIRSPAAASLFSTEAERPLLLDPTALDPMDHVRWEPVSATGPRAKWLWQPRGLTDAGWRTIEILRLDELADEVADHLRAAVLPAVTEVEQHSAGKRTRQARRSWDHLLESVLAPTASFSAASYWALECWVPRATRRTLGLADPERPGATVRGVELERPS